MRCHLFLHLQPEWCLHSSGVGRCIQASNSISSTHHTIFRFIVVIMELDRLFSTDTSDVLFYYALMPTVAATILALTWTSSSSKLNLPPGPHRWPVIGNLGELGCQPHTTLMNLAQLYGPLMYLQLGQRDCIVASSPETATEFLKTQDLNFASRPQMVSNVILLYNRQGTIYS